MSEPTAPKKRGRPSTGKALSSTERSRLLRERAERVSETASHPGRPLEGFADSVLLLAFGSACRDKHGALAEKIARELLLRIGIEATSILDDSVDATERQDIPVDATNNQASPITVDATNIQASNIPVDATNNQASSIPVDATNIQASSMPVAATDALTVAPSTSRSARDTRILELPELSEMKAAETLNAEGIKCSPRTVGNVRKRFAGGKL